MKIDRLLNIIILLLNRPIVQAKDLAERFEVSIRTIYRDIDAINQAGIPIVTYQGANGGIGLAEGYRLDRNLLTNEELAAIVTALQSVSSSYPDEGHAMLVEKISSIIPASQAEDFQFRTKQFVVDLSPWGNHDKLEAMILTLKKAIEERQAVRFSYRNAEGEATERTVHPYTLVLKGHAWYLYAYCTGKLGFRFFKLVRMKRLEPLDSRFEREDISLEERPWDKEWHAPERTVSLTLRFGPGIRHAAEEWFGAESLQDDETGHSIANVSLPDNAWLYGFILSFGPEAEVLEPESVRHRIRDLAAGIAANYR